jgi:hypothetical protein
MKSDRSFIAIKEEVNADDKPDPSIPKQTHSSGKKTSKSTLHCKYARGILELNSPQANLSRVDNPLFVTLHTCFAHVSPVHTEIHRLLVGLSACRVLEDGCFVALQSDPEKMKMQRKFHGRKRGRGVLLNSI